MIHGPHDSPRDQAHAPEAPGTLDDFACDFALGEPGLSQERVDASADRNTREAFFESYELAAAAVSLAMLPAIEPMPGTLRARVIASLQREMGATSARRASHASQRSDRSPEPRWSLSRLWSSPALGWTAAAAAIVVAALAWKGPTITALDLGAQRRQFMSSVGDVGVWNWVDFAHPATQEAPEISGVRGDVAWSSASQEGYLRFAGLPRNASNVERYQLWIIDKRGLEQRVNAGLFDSTGEETIVRFKPELPVDGPVIFAVTIEPPEGVVVSSLKRRVCAAIATKG